LDDDEVGLVNAEQEEADGKRQRRSLSNNVRRIMLGIAVHNFSFLLYKVIEVVARIDEARQDGNGYEYRLSVQATLVGLWYRQPGLVLLHKCNMPWCNVPSRGSSAPSRVSKG
jgi:hypothetical protein